MLFREYLKINGACAPAVGWVGRKAIHTAWATFPRYDWGSWLLDALNETKLGAEALRAAGFRCVRDAYAGDEAVLAQIDVLESTGDRGDQILHELEDGGSDWRGRAYGALPYSGGSGRPVAASYGMVFLYAGLEAWRVSTGGLGDTPDHAVVLRDMVDKYVGKTMLAEVFTSLRLTDGDGDDAPFEGQPYDFQKLLGFLKACYEGRAWVGERGFNECWQDMVGIEFLCWLLDELRDQTFVHPSDLNTVQYNTYRLARQWLYGLSELCRGYRLELSDDVLSVYRAFQGVEYANVHDTMGNMNLSPAWQKLSSLYRDKSWREANKLVCSGVMLIEAYAGGKYDLFQTPGIYMRAGTLQLEPEVGNVRNQINNAAWARRYLDSSTIKDWCHLVWNRFDLEASGDKYNFWKAA